MRRTRTRIKIKMSETMVDLRGARGTHAPPGPNSFNFMQFLGNFGKIVCWRPPGELASPPRGNPGSATVKTKTKINRKIKGCCDNYQT